MSVRVQVSEVSVRLGSVQALDSASLVAEPGQFVALLGPSGSGKTTMLNVLAGFLTPDQGHVRLGDVDVTRVAPHARELGIVFQSYALFPHMSVGTNVEFPLRMRGIRSGERSRRAEQALEMVGLAGFAPRQVATLSGGQRQRVALARAIVFEPRVLLLDEPLAALDKQLRESMQLELKALQQRVGVTTVAVTHDQVEALTMADVVAVMRDGRIEQVGSPEDIYLRPRTKFVAGFLGEANLLPVHDGRLPGFGETGLNGDGTAVVRPEQLGIRPAAPAADMRMLAHATIAEVTFQGARVRLVVALDEDPTTLLTVSEHLGAAQTIRRPGDRVVLELDRRVVHVISRGQGDAPGRVSDVSTVGGVGVE